MDSVSFGNAGIPDSTMEVEVSQGVETRTDKASDIKEKSKTSSSTVSGGTLEAKGKSGKVKVSSLSTSKESEEVNRRTKKRSVEETSAKAS